jgi:hypothetical protein
LIDGNLGTEFQYAGGSTYQRHAVVLFDQPIAITSIRQAACGNVTSPAATPWLMINYLMPDGSSAGGISNAKPNEHGLPYTLNGTITNSAGTVPKTTVQGIGIVTNSGANPTMGVAGFEVNGVMVTSSFAVPGLQTTVATFASAAAVAGFKPGMAVTGSKSGARGVVTAISGATMTVAIDGAGTLQNGEVLNGPTVNTANAKLYCTLSATGVVTGMTSADPGFVSWTPAGSNPYTGTITFPATLPTGNAPDADFPAGATLTASAEASNTVGTVVATSTSITPA